jgi:hypothetical protein
MQGLAIRATDGDIGKVADCYFDDTIWAVRYVVVKTGGWLVGRKVLIAPAAVRAANWERGVLHVDLTRDEVGSSPHVDTDKPVSRQLEERLHGHYGWPTYWASMPGEVDLVPPGQPPPPTVEKAEQDRRHVRAQPTGNPHLRSMREVIGYRIQASDGEIGHVEDFVIDGEQWLICFVIVATRNWLAGRKVLVAPAWFASIDWSDRKAHVELTRNAVKNSPRYTPSEPIDARYVAELHDYYGQPNRSAGVAAAPVDM